MGWWVWEWWCGGWWRFGESTPVPGGAGSTASSSVSTATLTVSLGSFSVRLSVSEQRCFAMSCSVWTSRSARTDAREVAMAETPFSLADKLLGWCFTILLAALALKIAVDVIAGIWPWLVVGLVVTGFVAVVGWVVVRWWRWR